MSKGIIAAGIGGLLILGLIGFLLVGSDDDTPQSNSTPTSIRTTDDQASEASEETNSTATVDETQEVETTTASGVYTNYSSSALTEANERDDKKVLFFHAGWCPTCKNLDRNINAGRVPDGLTILKLDYDSEDELKKRYGVTYQHTLVQVDEDGNLINKWAGSTDIDDIVEELT